MVIDSETDKLQIIELKGDLWLQDVRHLLSPNHDDRPLNCDIDLLVIHAISLPPEQFGGGYIEQLFTNRLQQDEHPYFKEVSDLRVSSHLLISRTGAITQFVPLNKRAWHAGESEFCGRSICNDFSIGIELEGSDHQAFTELQYQQLARVTSALRQRWPAITRDTIVGHSDIAPGRKTDPGPHFDWDRYFTTIQV